MFIQSAVEDLPEELDGVANEVHVHFPWGSLLRAVSIGDAGVMRSLRRICAIDALLEVVVGIDPVRDQSEIERLGIVPLTFEFIDDALAKNYRAAGFEIFERGILTSSQSLDTSWAKRLQENEHRRISFIVARAV